MKVRHAPAEIQGTERCAEQSSGRGPVNATSLYLRSWLVRCGLILFAVGCGTLLLIIVASSLGLTLDPKPESDRPGILFGISLWPRIRPCWREDRGARLR